MVIFRGLKRIMGMSYRIAKQFLLGLAACLLFNACLGSHQESATPAAAPAMSPGRVTLSPELLEQEVYHRVNAYRRSRGLSQQALDPRMSELAREHSRWMASSRGQLSHRGSEKRFRKLQSEPVMLVSFAENVAYNLGHADPAGVAVNGWIRSSGHHRNMTRRDDQLTGIGAARAKDGSWYFTQLFGER